MVIIADDLKLSHSQLYIRLSPFDSSRSLGSLLARDLLSAMDMADPDIEHAALTEQLNFSYKPLVIAALWASETDLASRHGALPDLWTGKETHFCETFPTFPFWDTTNFLSRLFNAASSALSANKELWEPWFKPWISTSAQRCLAGSGTLSVEEIACEDVESGGGERPIAKSALDRIFREAHIPRHRPRVSDSVCTVRLIPCAEEEGRIEILHPLHCVVEALNAIQDTPGDIDETVTHLTEAHQELLEKLSIGGSGGTGIVQRFKNTIDFDSKARQNGGCGDKNIFFPCLNSTFVARVLEMDFKSVEKTPLTSAEDALRKVRATLISCSEKISLKIKAIYNEISSTACKRKVELECSDASKIYSLLQRCGSVNSSSLPRLVAIAMAKEGSSLLKELEPMLEAESPECAEGVLALTLQWAILNVNLCQTNDTIKTTNILLRLLDNINAEILDPQNKEKSMRAARLLDSESRALMNKLHARRTYAVADENGSIKVDPRLVYVEFLMSSMLRSRQIELLDEFAKCVDKRSSGVRQLIMGQGKTQVLCPTLALLMADGKRSVTLVIPRQLLVQSEAALNEFLCNAILDRAPAVFSFERSTGQPPVQQFSSRLKSEAPTIPLCLYKGFNDIVADMYSMKDIGTSEVIHWPYQGARSDRGVAEVQYVRRKMESAIKDGRSFLSTPESVKCVLLRYTDLILAEKDCSCITRKKMFGLAADQVKQILELFKGPDDAPGLAIMDEFDSVMHPLRSQLNFPVHNKQDLDLGAIRWEIQMMMSDVVTAATIASKSDRQTGRLNILIHSEHSRDELVRSVKEGARRSFVTLSPHLIVLRPQWYYETILPILATVCLDWLALQKDGYINEALVRWNELDGDEAVDKMHEYLTSPPGRSPSNSITIRNITISKQCDDDTSVAILNLTKNLLWTVLPHVLSKTNCVHYGILSLSPDGLLSPDTNRAEPPSRALLACPFLAKDTPSPSSEFATADVRIMFTAFAYNYQGLRIADVANLVRRLKCGLQNHSGNMSETEECIIFQAWLEAAKQGGDIAAEASGRVPPLDLFPIGDPEAMKLLHAAICRVPEAIMTHLRTHAFEKTKSVHTEQVHQLNQLIILSMLTSITSSLRLGMTWPVMLSLESL